MDMLERRVALIATIKAKELLAELEAVDQQLNEHVKLSAAEKNGLQTELRWLRPVHQAAVDVWNSVPQFDATPEQINEHSQMLRWLFHALVDYQEFKDTGTVQSRLQSSRPAGEAGE
jgi:hypothetical protein